MLCNYVVPDNMPFTAYINQCSELIRNRRLDLNNGIDPNIIIGANTPYELRPDQLTPGKKAKYGALLIHGLLDSPYSLKDIGEQLKNHGILCRSILLPGHGTQPTDLLEVGYQEWMQTVHYGVTSLREEVENIFLVGFSTGGTLAIHKAQLDPTIKGIILIAPALKINAPVSTMLTWPILANFFSNHAKWLCQEVEVDYTKYESVPFHPVIQLERLIKEMNQLQQRLPLTCPIMVAMSNEDETVSAKKVLQFFTSLQNEKSQFLLYAKNNLHHHDSRILIRSSVYPELRISQFSHISMPYAPTNPHYGQQGDYLYCSWPEVKNIRYGAYNRIEHMFYEKLYNLRLLKERRIALSYNPDFDFMSQMMATFLKG